MTKSPYALVSSLLTGVMIDMDHLVEYYRWFVKGDTSKVYFFLHSYELLVPVFLSSYFSGWDPVVMGASFAFLGHLLTDQIVNPVMPLAYFVAYRAMKGFRRSELIKVEWQDIQRDFLRLPITRTIIRFFNPRFKVGE